MGWMLVSNVVGSQTQSDESNKADGCRDGKLRAKETEDDWWEQMCTVQRLHCLAMILKDAY